MARSTDKKIKINKIEKKKLKPAWQNNGVSRAAVKNTLPLLYKKIIELTKKGKIKEAKELQTKADKIRNSF